MKHNNGEPLNSILCVGTVCSVSECGRFECYFKNDFMHTIKYRKWKLVKWEKYIVKLPSTIF